ncbi:MAG: hypothetical protein GX323_04550 [Clostridiales bacterium]|nr:hypothetical protein [Clostridiales bacterium]
MYKIVNDFPNEFFNVAEGPIVSLYQPTHRHSPESKQDPIRFKNLIKEIEKPLSLICQKKEKQSILDLLTQISNDTKFWIYNNDAIAVFYARGEAIIYRLNRPTKELAVVSNNFHIKPLISNFQSADSYHVLGLNREGFTLFEGNIYGINEVTLDDDIPNNIKEVLGDEFTSSYISARYGGAKGQGYYHGYGEKSKLISSDTERFFRFIDKVVWDNFSKKSKLPLILVALPEYHSIFRRISDNPYLLEEGIKTNYDILTIDTLKEKMWELIEPIYDKRADDLIEGFENARAKSLGSDDLASVARAAVSNQVHTALIESDRVIPGKIDLGTGNIEWGELGHPEYGDLLNDIALIVMQNGGNVVMLPKDKMPTGSGIAATYRF